LKVIGKKLVYRMTIRTVVSLLPNQMTITGKMAMPDTDWKKFNNG